MVRNKCLGTYSPTSTRKQSPGTYTTYHTKNQLS